MDGLCPVSQTIKNVVRGELARTDVYRELSREELSVLVPVDSRTKLAYPQPWNKSDSVMPVFLEQATFEFYQSQQPAASLTLVRLKWSELLDWAMRLRLGLVIYVCLEHDDLGHMYVPAQEVASLAEAYGI